jgi:mono/diheme cytochrome c family protein
MRNKLVPLGWAVAILALAAPLKSLHAQEAAKATFTVDEALAKKGKSLWGSRGCFGCHTVGKGRIAGPDLAGVLQRRDVDWLKRWLKDTNEMPASDETAQALLKEFGGNKMPQVKLTDSEIDALLHYLAQEDAKLKK